MQICIKNKHLRVCSLPDYNEIAELSDKSRLQVNIPYVLAFYLYNPKDFIRIVEVAAVDAFEDRTGDLDNFNNQSNYDTDDNCDDGLNKEEEYIFTPRDGYSWSRGGSTNSISNEVKRNK